MIGETLAHYEILGLLGKGGMGEVYRARDAKLGRDVAIKILPAEVSGDPERAARFEREARTLASLQHANVASIYGFEEVNGTRFLVMELVEGRDLESRIAAGRLPLDETLRIARQIATGLEAAHERGIVHRDLKPANIMLTDAGEAKILDFGLARAWFGDVTDDASMAHSPTITNAMTQAGVILGTAAYMSPEQARGRSVDRRADIWAFGVILWEMLTGQRLFQGETVSDTLAAVLRAEPDWTLLPVDEAPRLCQLIERCLVRDPQQRLRDIGEARILLQDGGSQSSLASISATRVRADDANVHAGRPARGAWLAAIGMALAAAVFAALYFTRSSGPALSLTTLGLPREEAMYLSGGAGWSSVQFSPDGNVVAYVGGEVGKVYLRSVDAFESTKLSDTEGARLPVFSPDGRWIAYFANSKLWKVAVSGGAPIEICGTAQGPGLAWGQGELYFCRAMGGGLWAVSENGGEPRPISVLDDSRDETSHRWPSLLPDGRHILLTIKTARIATFDDASIGLLSLDSGEITTLLQGGSNPRYVSSGHIVYGRDSQLFAIGFDLKTLSIRGTPTSVLDGIHISGLTGSTYYAVSPQGHLAYVPTMANFWEFGLVWLQRSGKTSALEVDLPASYSSSISPDGTRFAAAVSAANDKIWVCDLQQKTTSRLSNTPGNDNAPVWSPDGTQVVYHNDRNGSWDLCLVAADGSAPAERLLESETDDTPTSWSPAGVLLFNRIKPDGDIDIWSMRMAGDHEVKPFLQSPHSEADARFSPDGAWVAYVSDSSGRAEVYARPYPGPGNPIRISRSGGDWPAWSRDGRTLYYRAEASLMAVAIERNADLSVGAPTELLALGEGIAQFALRAQNYAGLTSTPDGQRFLVTQSNLDAKQDQIRVVFDWAERLKGR